MEKAEAEVKVKRRTGSCLLNLSLNLNLPITLADFVNSLPVGEDCAALRGVGSARGGLGHTS